MKNIFFLMCLMGTLIACNDISDIGEDILDRDGILASVNKDFSFKTKTQTTDSILVYLANNPSPFTRFVGQLDDPLLGKTDAEFYKEFVLGSLAYTFSDTSVIDSIVLSLAIDSNRTAGIHKDVRMDFLVYELTEQLNRSTDYYSDFSIRTKSLPIGEAYDKSVSLDNIYYETLPNKEDDDVIDTLFSMEDIVRIPLSEEFGKRIMNLSPSILEDNDLFRKTFNGLKVKGISENTLLALKAGDDGTRISIYYKEGDERKIAHLVNSPYAPTLNSFNYEPEAGIMNPLFNDFEKGDSILAVSGLLGPDIKLQFDDLSGLQGKLINYAEIKVYAAGNEIDTEMYPPLSSLNLYYFDSNGDRFLVPDLSRAFNSSDVNQAIEANFGGGIIEEDSVYSYTMNISEFAQRLVDDPDINSLEISSRSKAYNSGRSIIYGADHSKYPIEVTFYFSEIK